MLSFFKQKDKQKHIFGSALLVVLLYFVLKSLFLAGVGALVVGVGKEVYDHFHPKKHTADIKDILADIVGILIALGVLYAIS